MAKEGVEGRENQIQFFCEFAYVESLFVMKNISTSNHHNKNSRSSTLDACVVEHITCNPFYSSRFSIFNQFINNRIFELHGHIHVT